MNNDLLRVFETESDYDSAKDSFVYPTVSYVRDVDEVRYMTNSNLPIIDTSDLQTHFIFWQSYPDVVPIFQAIFDQYGSSVIVNPVAMLIYQNKNDEDVQIYIGDEPLFQNYLSELTISKSSTGTVYDVITIEINENSAVLKNDGATVQGIIWYSDGKMTNNIPM